MMRKSMVASGLIVAVVALLVGATPSTAEAFHRSRRCCYSSCRSSCNTCYSGCSTCYAPSSCNTCYAPCAPACTSCAPACTTCAPACNTCNAAPSCCGNGYSSSYRSAPAYVSYSREPYYYSGIPQSNVIVTPVRYEVRRTSYFGW
jgi:hypothetical protein